MNVLIKLLKYCREAFSDRRTRKKELDLELADLKQKLAEDAEDFDRKSKEPVRRVPNTNPPEAGYVPTVTELILQDVDPLDIERMLFEGRARRDD